MTYMTGWARTVDDNAGIRAGGLYRRAGRRVPIDEAHAFVAGEKRALCGAVIVFDNGTPWPPPGWGGLCVECRNVLSD